MNDIFSSRDFEAKFDRSRKLRVEIGSEEKNAGDGREGGEGRFAACLVSMEVNNAEKITYFENLSLLIVRSSLPFKSGSKRSIPCGVLPAFSRTPPRLP